MTDNELLLSISDMMDKKFQSELQPIKNDLQEMKGRLQNVEVEVQEVKDRLQNVEAEVQEVRTEVQEVKGRLQNVEAEVQEVRTEVQNVKDRLQSVETGLQTVESKVHQMSLFQENVIMPRLCTIESCYTDTYNRYRSYVDKMDGVFVDVELLKSVVSDHTRKLQKLA